MAGATFPIHRARATLSGQGSNVRANTDVRTGAGAIGGAVSGAGRVASQIAIQNRDLIDQSNMIKANGAQQKAVSDFQLFQSQNPDPEAWDKEWQRITGELDTELGSLNLSNHARATLDTQFDSWNNLQSSKIERVVNEGMKVKLVEQMSAEVIKAYELDLDNKVKMMQEWAGKGVEAGISPEELKKRQGLLVLEGLRGRARLNPQGTSAFIQGEIDARKQGNAGSLPSSVVSHDLDQIQGYADSLSDIRKKRLADQAKAEIERQELEIQQMMVDGDFEKALEVIQKSGLDADTKEKWRQRVLNESDRLTVDSTITTDERVKGDLLDRASGVGWPGGDSAAIVLMAAGEARYGENPTIDDSAYNEIRDAIRRGGEGKPPYTQGHIETVIGELTTGAPVDIMGQPLESLRTREDAMKYATNKLGRWATRIPDVMGVINAKWPKSSGPSNTAAYDFGGQAIGDRSDDGTITLNDYGLQQLLTLAGGDVNRAREIALANNYIIPAAAEE